MARATSKKFRRVPSVIDESNSARVLVGCKPTPCYILLLEDPRLLYWAALSLSFRLISIRLLFINIKAWGPQVKYVKLNDPLHSRIGILIFVHTAHASQILMYIWYCIVYMVCNACICIISFYLRTPGYYYVHKHPNIN